MELYPMIARLAGQQELIVRAGLEQDLELAYQAFIQDPLCDLSLEDSRRMFDEMVENTRDYLWV